MESTFRYVLSSLPPDSFENAVQAWQAAIGGREVASARGTYSHNLSVIANLAIAIIRTLGQFSHIPPANRCYARNIQSACETILNPLPLPP